MWDATPDRPTRARSRSRDSKTLLSPSSPPPRLAPLSHSPASSTSANTTTPTTTTTPGGASPRCATPRGVPRPSATSSSSSIAFSPPPVHTTTEAAATTSAMMMAQTLPSRARNAPARGLHRTRGTLTRGRSTQPPQRAPAVRGATTTTATTPVTIGVAATSSRVDVPIARGRSQHRSGAPSSHALWRINAANPQPPHLSALPSSSPPWPGELPWRRSKPLTRRVTTTLRPTPVAPLSSRRPSHTTESGLASVTETAPMESRSGTTSLPTDKELVMTGEVGASNTSMLHVHGGTVKEEKRDDDNDEVVGGTQQVLEAIEILLASDNADASRRLDLELASNGEASGIAVDVSAVCPAVAGAVTPAILESLPSRSPDHHQPKQQRDGLLHEQSQQSTYATAHHLPDLFAEMLEDLTAAQASTDQTISLDADAWVIEAWMQRWFRQRYEAAQAPFASPSSPLCVVKPSTRGKPLKGLKRGSAQVYSGEQDVLKQSTNAASVVSLSSVNQKFVPLSVQPTSEGNGQLAGEEASLCASLNSTSPTPSLPQQRPPTTVPSPPPPSSSNTTTTSSSQPQPQIHSPSAAMALLTAHQHLTTPPPQLPKPGAISNSSNNNTTIVSSTAGSGSGSSTNGTMTGSATTHAPASCASPPASAGRRVSSARPPAPPRPPTSHPVGAVAKNSLSGAGAALVRPGRAPATSACAVVGQTPLTAPEAAHANK